MLLAAGLTVSGLSAVQTPFSAAQTDEAVGASQYVQSTIKGAAILHCFNWSYTAIKDNLADIAAAGYTAVQTSPVQQPKSYNPNNTGVSSQWWKMYQPLTLSIADGGTWLGTKAELVELCKEAHRYKIKVIVDIVANHLANNTKGGGYSHLNAAVESDLKHSAYYHPETYDANDDSRYDMTHGHIGMPDLNTGNSHVQQRVLGLLKECVDCGVDGFRFDAAKHIELPTDDSNTRSSFWPTVINGIKSYKSDVFCYGEILNGTITDISNYTAYFAITDNKTGNSALSAANSGNAATLASSTYKLGAGASNSVLWAESHDTYMTGPTSDISNSVIFKAWAITGARAKSTSLYLARPNSVMGKASSDGGWKGSVPTEVNKFKNYFMGQSEYLASSGDVAYIERGTKGVCIAKLNGAGSVSLDAHQMASGTYKDQLTGNTFTVSGGKITGTVGSKGVAVVYNAPKNSEPPTPTKVEEIQVTVGDVNGNGSINVKDVTALQRKLAKIETYPHSDVTGDCDNNGTVNINDVTLIQQYLSEFADTGSVGQKKMIPPDTCTVYFTNSRGWSDKIYCYYWSDSSTHLTTWPGEPMTYSSTNGSGQKIYTINVPENVDYLIFNNNASQTVNIPFDGSVCRFYAKSATDSNGRFQYGTW